MKMSDVTRKVREIRRTNRYMKSLLETRKRDGDRCQLTGQWKGDLDVHHIIPMVTMVKQWMEAPECYKEFYYNKIFDVDNMIVVREDLHRTYHSLHGRKKDQHTAWKNFKEFYTYNPMRNINVTEEIITFEDSMPLTVVTVSRK